MHDGQRKIVGPKQLVDTHTMALPTHTETQELTSQTELGHVRKLNASLVLRCVSVGS